MSGSDLSKAFVSAYLNKEAANKALYSLLEKLKSNKQVNSRPKH